MTKHIGIMCATYNEEENVLELFKAIQSQLDPLRDDFSYSVLFIDNNSTDSTQLRLSELASNSSKVQCIYNERNYGANRSSFHGMLQTPGDAVIMMCGLSGS